MWKLSVMPDAAFCAANPVQQPAPAVAVATAAASAAPLAVSGRGSRNQFDFYAHIICITLFAHPPSALNFQIPNKSASEMLFQAFLPAVFALFFFFFVYAALWQRFLRIRLSVSCSPSLFLSPSCFEVTAADFHSRWFLALTVSSFASLTDSHLIYAGPTVSVCVCEWLCNWPNWRMSNMKIE